MIVKNGIQFKHTSLTSSKLMHHKFAVIDNKILINGSFNWTTSAARTNYENIMITTDKRFVSHYVQLFDQLWRKLSHNMTKEEANQVIKKEANRE